MIFICPSEDLSTSYQSGHRSRAMQFQETGISEKPMESGKQYTPGYVLQLRVHCCKKRKTDWSPTLCFQKEQILQKLSFSLLPIAESDFSPAQCALLDPWMLSCRFWRCQPLRWIQCLLNSVRSFTIPGVTASTDPDAHRRSRVFHAADRVPASRRTLQSQNTVRNLPDTLDRTKRLVRNKCVWIRSYVAIYWANTELHPITLLWSPRLPSSLSCASVQVIDADIHSQALD